MLCVAGVDVAHTVTITNDGNVALRNFNLTAEDNPISITCNIPASGRLEVNAVVTCQIVYVIDQDAMELGTITHGAEVLASPPAQSTTPFVKSLQLAAVTATASPSLSVMINTANCAVPGFAGEQLMMESIVCLRTQLRQTAYSQNWERKELNKCVQSGHVPPFTRWPMHADDAELSPVSRQHGLLLCHAAGTDLQCTDAVVVENTGNRRLTGVAIAGSATCQMQSGVVLEPSQQFICSVRSAALVLMPQGACMHMVFCCTARCCGECLHTAYHAHHCCIAQKTEAMQTRPLEFEK